MAVCFGKSIRFSLYNCKPFVDAPGSVPCIDSGEEVMHCFLARLGLLGLLIRFASHRCVPNKSNSWRTAVWLIPFHGRHVGVALNDHWKSPATHPQKVANAMRLCICALAELKYALTAGSQPVSWAGLALVLAKMLFLETWTNFVESQRCSG